MSTSVMPRPVEPKRKRGHERVAAIIAAATGLFAERGYSAVTMTEVAARSSTAVGSLYRFFPTKEVLAAAVLDRYGATLTTELEQIAEKADPSTVEKTALSLVRMIRQLKKERAGALAMADAQENAVALRDDVRHRMLVGLTLVLARTGGHPVPSAIDPRAWMLLYALKAVRQLDLDRPELTDRLDQDAVDLLIGYLLKA